jgi:hypothetical protein
MKLYHFTCEDLLPSILIEGLNKGDVPFSPTMGANAVWFTTDPNAEGHGVFSGGGLLVTPAMIESLGTAGAELAVGETIHFLDKQKIRIRVEFQTSKTPGLFRWLDVAKKEKIDRNWLKRLHDAAGANAKPHTWWLWRATLPPEFFQAVEVRTPDGYVSVLERPDLLSEDVRHAIMESVDEAVAA